MRVVKFIPCTVLLFRLFIESRGAGSIRQRNIEDSVTVHKLWELDTVILIKQGLYGIDSWLVLLDLRDKDKIKYKPLDGNQPKPTYYQFVIASSCCTTRSDNL